MTTQAYLPFRGQSGWFSCSINPAVIQLWDFYGGTLAGEDEANYLFSDDASSKDTMRVYETQQDVAVFQSLWIHKVIENSCSVHDVPIGQYLLLPHYLSPGETDSPPHLTSTHVHVASHTTSTNAGTARDNSHKGTNGNKPTRTCTAYNSPRRPVDTNNPLTERASAMFAEYNATWDELECRLNKTDLKDIADAEQVPCVINASVVDFVTSQPGFKIRKL